jgi:hypothetical protein
MAVAVRARGILKIRIADMTGRGEAVKTLVGSV